MFEKHIENYKIECLDGVEKKHTNSMRMTQKKLYMKFNLLVRFSKIPMKQDISIRIS